MCFISYIVKGKGTVVSVHATNVRKGSRFIALLILNLGDRWRSVINITPRPLYPLEVPQYSLNRRLGGPLSWSGRFEGQENLLPLPGFEAWIVQPVA